MNVDLKYLKMVHIFVTHSLLLMM